MAQPKDQPVSSSTSASGNDASASVSATTSSRVQIDFLWEHTEGQNVHDYYDVVKVIGTGSISTITKVRKKSAGGHSVRTKKDSIKNDGLCGGFGCCRISKHQVIGDDETAHMATNEPPLYFAMKTIDTSRVDVSNKFPTKCDFFSFLFQLTVLSIIYHTYQEVYMEELRNEIAIFRKMDHPNNLKANDVFERKKHIYLIMELASGGDIYARAPYSEKQAAHFVGKLLSAVAYMHSQNIMHRDCK